MFATFSKIYPGRAQKKYKKILTYSDITLNASIFIGTVVIFGIIIGAAAAVTFSIFYPLLPITAAVIFFVFFLFAQMIAYLLIILRADSKAKIVEEVLPDALLLMSMNIKSGMTTDRALITAARPEFGPLEKELTKAGRDIFTGSDIKSALLAMTQRIDSSLFDRTIRLIIEGIETGGELSVLLQQTAQDIQNTRLVQNEVKSSVLMYVIFIFFATAFGAPLLFGISTYLVSTITTQFSVFQASGMSQSATMSLKISPGFLVQFAMISLAVTSFFGGLIMGVVKNGDEKSGLKFIPMLMVITFVVFFVVRTLVATVFPSIV
jgi:pilus assembly protein TadC